MTLRPEATDWIRLWSKSTLPFDDTGEALITTPPPSASSDRRKWPAKRQRLLDNITPDAKPEHKRSLYLRSPPSSLPSLSHVPTMPSILDPELVAPPVTGGPAKFSTPRKRSHASYEDEYYDDEPTPRPGRYNSLNVNRPTLISATSSLSAASLSAASLATTPSSNKRLRAETDLPLEGISGRSINVLNIDTDDPRTLSPE